MTLALFANMETPGLDISIRFTETSAARRTPKPFTAAPPPGEVVSFGEAPAHWAPLTADQRGTACPLTGTAKQLGLGSCYRRRAMASRLRSNSLRPNRDTAASVAAASVAASR